MILESRAVADVAVNPQAVEILRSPSYPQRVHIHERAEWQALLQSWETRIAEARSQRSSHLDPASSRLYAQMLGARDQIADAVRRLPMEVGSLYDEDRHRVTEAVAALERLFNQWNA